MTHPTPRTIRTFCTFSTLQALCGIAAVLAASGSVFAQEATPSLADRKLAIIRGTAPGVVIYDPAKAKQAAAPGSNAGSNAGATDTGSAPANANAKPATTPEKSAAATPAKSGFLSTFDPPSGRTKADLIINGSKEPGFVLPTASNPSRNN